MYTRMLLLSLALLFPGIALAHAELSASSIEDGAAITEPLTEVSLTFSEAAELGFSTFKVYPLPVQSTGRELEPTNTEAHGDTSNHDDTTSDDHGGNATAAAEGDDHGDDNGHGALDAAAETLMAEVIGTQDDAEVRVDTGVTPASGQSETVTLQLKGDLGPGAYAVMWKVLSVDSHTIEGFLTFTYDPGA